MRAADFLVPGILTFTLMYGLLNGRDVLSLFIEGAADGLKTSLKIFPVLLAMITAIYMLRASGAIDMFAYAVKPLYAF
ncbi:MAG: spore maturation protein, partial [Bacillota bacterium]|nr:spore maturation protein [Bacillota bacterium]